MNFNGLFHKFSKEDSRPKYVSFRYRVSKTQPVRGFFNVFLSSATEPYDTWMYFISDDQEVYLTCHV